MFIIWQIMCSYYVHVNSWSPLCTQTRTNIIISFIWQINHISQQSGMGANNVCACQAEALSFTIMQWRLFQIIEKVVIKQGYTAKKNNI